MYKNIATFFICSFIALVVNSTRIDSADNANPTTRSNSQYEVTPFPNGPIIRTIPPGLTSHQLDEISNESKSGGLPSTVAGTYPPKAVSFISQAVTAPILAVQDSTNGSLIPAISSDPTTTSPASTLPTITPTSPNTTNGTVTPTTTTPATTTTTATNTTTLPTTTTSLPPTTTPPPTPPTPGTTSGTTTAAVTTTPAPAPTAAPSKDRRFDGPSFIGGIVLSLGIMAIGFVAWKFYKARTERNYHTL